MDVIGITFNGSFKNTTAGGGIVVKCCGVWKNWTNACSKSLLLDVLAENTSHGICKILNGTTCQIRIKLVKIKDVIREQSRVFSPDEPTAETEGHVKLNEATGMRMLFAVFESDDESVEQQSSAVHSKKSKDTAIETEAIGFAKGKGHMVSIQQAGSRTTVKAISDKSKENGIVADGSSILPVLKSRSGRNIKKKLHHDELESDQKEKIENKVIKSRTKCDSWKKQDYKVFVNLGELSEDVDLNPKVLLKRIDESDTKKRKSSAVQMTRSGRKIRKKTWWNEVDEIPTSESENELAHDEQDDEATSEFTDSADDVGRDSDYFDDTEFVKENDKNPENKRVKDLFRADIHCALCDKTVSSKPYLQMHMKYVHKDDENVLKCSQCPDIFGTDTELKEHVHEKHEKVIEKKERKPAKGPRVQCALCGKGFPASLKYKLSHHIKELHPEAAFNCEQCNYSCLSVEELGLHTKRRHSRVERIKCTLCDVRFAVNRKYKMNEHLRKEHSDVALNCDQCRFVCLSNEELDGHVQSRHGSNNTVQCPVCGKAFSSRQYKEHARTEHADVSLKCEKCKFSCLSSEELEQHIQDRHFATIKCGLCGERFPITKHYGFSEHIKKQHPDQGLKCNQCSYVFLSDHQLQMHIKRSHSKATSQSKRTKIVKCTVCEEVFRSQFTLENHLIRQHQQKAKHTCRHCAKGFISACLLKAHEFSHNTKKPFLCNQCGKSFKTLVSLKGHQRVKHEDNVQKRMYQCTLCGREFNLKYQLEDHRLKQHEDQMVFKCEKCEKRFESREILAQHQEGKGEKCAKSICIKCNKLFLSHYELQKHMRAHAKEEATENYLCTVCGKSFRFPAQFKIHLETHAPEPKYECHICGKKTFTQGNLRGHMIAHQTVRKYHCEVCGKGFKTSSKLKNHFVIHTGEKNHVCDICGKAFNHNGTLWLHRKDVHKVSRTKPPAKNQKKNYENFTVGTGEILKQRPTRKEEVIIGNGDQLQQKPGVGGEVVTDNMGNILGQEVSTEEIIVETMEYSEFVKDLHDNSN